MESTLFTELTLTEQENLSGGQRRRNLPVIQVLGNVSAISQQANATAISTEPNSIVKASASNFAIVFQQNQGFILQQN